MNGFEFTLQVTYTSILKKEYRTREFITNLVNHATTANKKNSIGGHIEIQYPFKFIKQIIYGKESVIMSLYRKIKNDFHHTITSEDIRIIRTKDAVFDIVYVNRQIGTHYSNVDTMELQMFPTPPNTPVFGSRRHEEQMM